jgi:hypothetical protein
MLRSGFVNKMCATLYSGAAGWPGFAGAARAGVFHNYLYLSPNVFRRPTGSSAILNHQGARSTARNM